MQDTASTQTLKASRPSGLLWLGVAAVISIVLWQLPQGYYIMYPFTILSTWFHEMGHGLTALLLGADFLKLEMFPDASGVATHTDNVFLGNLGRAMVAAGGLLGPPIAGAILILTGKQVKIARISLAVLGIVLALSVVIWIRTLFGMMMISGFAVTILLISRFSPAGFQRFVVQFLGVQACISTFTRMDYLFTGNAVIDGNVMHSDTGQMAEQLLLPYWFWGALLAAVSVMLMAAALVNVSDAIRFYGGEKKVSEKEKKTKFDFAKKS